MRTFFVLALELLMFASLQLLAPEGTVSERGTVVSRLNRVMVLFDEDAKTNRKYDIPTEAPITLDGKPADIDALQAGDIVVVSLTENRTITKVEATSGKRQDSISETRRGRATLPTPAGFVTSPAMPEPSASGVTNH